MTSSSSSTALHDFTVDDFDNTDFVIVGTDGDDMITGTEGDDSIFAAGGDDQSSRSAATTRSMAAPATTSSTAAPASTICSARKATTRSASPRATTAALHGGDGDDMLFGSDSSFNFFDNTFNGDDGNDDLQAGAVGSTADRRLRARTGWSAARPTTDRSAASTRHLRARRRPGPVRLQRHRAVERGRQLLRRHGRRFEDGSDLFDLRGSGLQFADLTIVNDGDFGPTIESSLGKITVSESFGDVTIDASDFLF